MTSIIKNYFLLKFFPSSSFSLPFASPLFCSASHFIFSFLHTLELLQQPAPFSLRPCRQPLSMWLCLTLFNLLIYPVKLQQQCGLPGDTFLKQFESVENITFFIYISYIYSISCKGRFNMFFPYYVSQ